MQSGLNPSSSLGSGSVVDRYVTKTRERSKELMREREAEIEAGIEHLTPAELGKRNSD